MASPRTGRRGVEVGLRTGQDQIAQAGHEQQHFPPSNSLSFGFAFPLTTFSTLKGFLHTAGRSSQSPHLEMLCQDTTSLPPSANCKISLDLRRDGTQYLCAPGIKGMPNMESQNKDTQ